MLDLVEGVELVVACNHVIARPFFFLLRDPGLGFLVRGEALHLDQVVFGSKVGKYDVREIGWVGLLLVAHRRIDPFLGWQWHLGG